MYYDWTKIMTRRKSMPRTMDATRFREQCLALLDALEPEGIVITKHGQPLYRLVPYARECDEL